MLAGQHNAPRQELIQIHERLWSLIKSLENWNTLGEPLPPDDYVEKGLPGPEYSAAEAYETVLNLRAEAGALWQEVQAKSDLLSREVTQGLHPLLFTLFDELPCGPHIASDNARFVVSELRNIVHKAFDRCGQKLVAVASLITLHGTESDPNSTIWSQARSPKTWRNVLKEFGMEMSQSTFARRIKDGTFKVHPDATTKSVSLLIASLPPEFRAKFGR